MWEGGGEDEGHGMEGFYVPSGASCFAQSRGEMELLQTSTASQLGAVVLISLTKTAPDECLHVRTTRLLLRCTINTLETDFLSAQRSTVPGLIRSYCRQGTGVIVCSLGVSLREA